MKTPLFLILFLLGLISSSPGQTVGSAFETATVYRDGNAVPHVFAPTDRAAFYGFGRVQMRDLPVSVAYNYALAAGELSSIFGEGPPGERGIPLHVMLDTRSQLWRIQQRALAQKAVLPLDVRHMLMAFVKGLNDSRQVWLQDLSPLVFNTEPYAYDLATLTRLMSRNITLDDVLMFGIFTIGQYAFNAAEALAFDDDPNASEDHKRKASNSYAIAPAASTGGAAMLLADPHLPFQKYSTLRTYFGQVRGPSYDMCGFSIPGFPCMAVGFNDDFGWAITANNPDSMDVWRARAARTGANFLVDGSPVPIIRSTSSVAVFDFQSGQIVQRPVKLAWAGNLDQPILRETAVITASGLAGPRTIWFARTTLGGLTSAWEFLIRLGQARSVEQARQVFQMGIASGNYLMADSTGDLGYIWSGIVPIRKDPTPGTTWAQIQDGNTSAHFWLGIHPVRDLPWEQLSRSDTFFAEEEKWLQCNSAADLVRPHSSLDLSTYPEYMVHQDTTPETWRQRWGRELLNRKPQLDGSDLRSAATDIQDIWFTALARHIDLVVEEFALERHANVALMMTALRNWDRIADIHDTEPVYSHMIYAFFVGLQRRAAEKGTPAHPVFFHTPEEVPDLEEWMDADWREVRENMAAAILKSANTHGNLLNTLLPGVTFPGSPWTPDPWVSFSTSVPEWGTAHYVTLTPFSAPGDAAIYPTGGTISQFSLVSDLVPLVEDTIIPDAGILGQVGPLISYPLDAGAHTLFQVTFSSPIKAWYLEALGPTEIASDPNRYAHAANFANRVWLPFHCDLPTVSSQAASVDQFQLNVAIFGP